MLDNTPNQPSKFKTKNDVSITSNNESRGTCGEDNQIRFNTLMLRLRSCGYSDAYILVKGTVTVTNNELKSVAANNANRKVVFKNCAPFTNCINRINSTQVGNAHDIHVVMPMYNLIEYSDNYSKISGIFWKYCRDKPAINVANGNIVDFNAANATTNSFKIKETITDQTGNNGTKNVEIILPLKYLSNFWRTLEMPLINVKLIFN